MLEAILKGAVLHTSFDTYAELVRVLTELLISSLAQRHLWSIDVTSRFLDLGGAEVVLRDMSRYQEHWDYRITLFERRRLLIQIHDSIERGEMQRYAPLLTRMSETLSQDNAQIPPVGDDRWLLEEQMSAMAAFIPEY